MADVDQVEPCTAYDPTCEDCVERGLPHPGEPCDDVCSLAHDLLSTPSGHKALHAAQRWHRCGAKKGIAGENLIRSRCKYGNCNIWSCPCGAEESSDGPIACPCKTGWFMRLTYRLWAWAWRDR